MAQVEKIDLSKLNETNYVDVAEDLMRTLKNAGKNGCPDNPIYSMTTTKIRSLLTLVNRIENAARLEEGDLLSSELQQELLHAQIRFVYESGREAGVKKFLELSQLLELLKTVVHSHSKKDFELLARYFEALVAYHRFFGGKE